MNRFIIVVLWGGCSKLEQIKAIKKILKHVGACWLGYNIMHVQHVKTNRPLVRFFHFMTFNIPLFVAIF